MIRKEILRRYALVFNLAAVFLLIGAVVRVVLWYRFGRPADVSLLHLPMLLGAGVVNDAVQSLYLLAPLATWILLSPDRWYRSRANRVLLTVGSVVTVGLFIYLGVTEVYFFEEFDARFNLVAYDYLAYPNEVFTDIWQAYPVARVLAVTMLLAVVAGWALRRRIVASAAVDTTFAARLRPYLPFAAALALVVVYYPTDALSGSANRVENEIAQNGYSSFFRAARTSDIEYSPWYESRASVENLRTLQEQFRDDGGAFTRIGQGMVDRRFPGRADGLGRLNVVVVSSESFGAEFSKLYGSARDLTPEFDRYAQQGLWFSNTYASGTRTVRGLEAISASFPPIPTVSILRRPGNQHIATWGEVMQKLGYSTSFLYGGYSYFDDMKTYFAGNGFQVIDRSDIEHVRFENIWGVSDEDLFDKAIEHFGAEHASGRPFFSIIMTTSNHKPFTFRPGLESHGIKEKGGGRRAGVRYADYALGYFLREAAKQPWFDDTVFVVVADHGARVYGKADIPLKSYEIPLMFYSPKHLAPRRVDTLMTQIDIAPTVLGLLGLPYEAPFFGEDVLDHPNERRVALFSHNHDIAILEGNRLMVYGLGGGSSEFLYDRARDTFTPVAKNPALEALGIAYFQTASELFASHRYQ